ncbi:cyclic nucleotide-binding domain-containing protein [Saccharothrix australiensis]|uniref:CRP-like cAMP-binding protein n=1 Tax=Saccharothrix australiensis TaxID=2072 RepID=A0A495W0E9_9PSEU|nr:cyclic nucleotide-binding domain-containing protein [Saccharothrix australiensis]RKT55086.1 CRP-like cAMP-binding protein [Saccharothrix australiensis]
MNSRVVELESVLSRPAPDRREARHLAIELADTLDPTTVRRHVDRLLRCVTALTRIDSADAGEELLDAMLDVVEPGSPEAVKVRDQRALIAVARGRSDLVGRHIATPWTGGTAGPMATTRVVPEGGKWSVDGHVPTLAAAIGVGVARARAERLPAAVGDRPPAAPDLLTDPAADPDALESDLSRSAAALGADHPHTLALLISLRSARFQIARDQGGADRVGEALADLREATDRAVTALGPHHPQSLVARANLASAEFELARVRRSADQAQLVLPSLRGAADLAVAKLGPDHPHSLVAQSNLAAAELEVARVEGAHAQARRALDTVRTAASRAVALHGTSHPAARLLARQLRACEAHVGEPGTRRALEDVHVPVEEAARLLARSRPAIPLTRGAVPGRPPVRVTASTPGALATDPQWPDHSLLGRLRDHTRQELLTVGTVVRYAADRELIEQDARDTHAFLLLDGMVKVQVTDEAGDTAVLAIRAAGDLVGEMAALDHRPRSATVVTCGDVVAKLITSAELTAFLHRRNDMFVELISVVDDQLRWANKRRRDFLSHTAAERVARVLAELVGSYGREERGGWTLGIPLTKVELASMAGMKPRTAEKAFSDLRKAGVVVSHYRRDVLVPDLEHLRRFARME